MHGRPVKTTVGSTRCQSEATKPNEQTYIIQHDIVLLNLNDKKMKEIFLVSSREKFLLQIKGIG
jgi:hypothetical protein